MICNRDQYEAIPLGIVVRRHPGVTRWAKWVWRAVAVLPGAGPADWQVMRTEKEVTEYHAATVMLELHGAEAEAYHHSLQSDAPAIYVVLRETDSEMPYEVLLATASPYEAQDHGDSGEDIVEKIPMPPRLQVWIEDFIERFYTPQEFKKRRRANWKEDGGETVIGDPRVEKLQNIYHAPGTKRRGRLQ